MDNEFDEIMRECESYDPQYIQAMIAFEQNEELKREEL